MRQSHYCVPIDTGKTPVNIRAHVVANGVVRLDAPDGPMQASWDDGLIRLDGVARPVRVIRSGDHLTVLLAGVAHPLRHVDPLAGPGAEASGTGHVAAPIPARVTRVLVASGDVMMKGAKLIVVEAMKTEITLTAPRDGTVESVRAAVGEMVEAGTELVTFQTSEGAKPFSP